MSKIAGRSRSYDSPADIYAASPRPPRGSFSLFVFISCLFICICLRVWIMHERSVSVVGRRRDAEDRCSFARIRHCHAPLSMRLSAFFDFGGLVEKTSKWRVCIISGKGNEEESTIKPLTFFQWSLIIFLIKYFAIAGCKFIDSIVTCESAKC